MAVLVMASALLAGLAACEDSSESRFESDVAFLSSHNSVLVLKNGKSAVAVVPEYQGRVMTSTSDGSNSFGWINREAVAAGVLEGEAARGKTQAHMHPFGGEERFWIGPEGGQFGFYFKGPDPFDFEHWKTPPQIDTEPFKVEESGSDYAKFSRDFKIKNYSGKEFSVRVDREIRVLDRSEVEKILGMKLPENASVVGYYSDNKITNTGSEKWSRDTGLMSIWILGMYNSGESATIAIPVKGGDDLGPKVRDDYFGKISSDRLKIVGDTILLKADSKSRGKIGITPLRSRGTAGSYDAGDGSLTLLFYEKPKGENLYVNSLWEHQKNPYDGDEINAYNDGPAAPGMAQMGAFYEIESSSPAKELGAGESLSHRQYTVHISSKDKAVLNKIAENKLGISADSIAENMK